MQEEIRDNSYVIVPTGHVLFGHFPFSFKRRSYNVIGPLLQQLLNPSKHELTVSSFIKLQIAAGQPHSNKYAHHHPQHPHQSAKIDTFIAFTKSQ